MARIGSLFPSSTFASPQALKLCQSPFLLQPSSHMAVTAIFLCLLLLPGSSSSLYHEGQTLSALAHAGRQTDGEHYLALTLTGLRAATCIPSKMCPRAPSSATLSLSLWAATAQALTDHLSSDAKDGDWPSSASLEALQWQAGKELLYPLAYASAPAKRECPEIWARHGLKPLPLEASESCNTPPRLGDIGMGDVGADIFEDCMLIAGAAWEALYTVRSHPCARLVSVSSSQTCNSLPLSRATAPSLES